MNSFSETNFYLENIYDSLKSELQRLELELKTQLYSITKNKIDLHNVINYFFEIPGKRLRPILTILSAGTVTPRHLFKKEVIELAAALELIHNSSLIHDDIVDESQKRRGQMTMNYKFNNKIAVLAGDLLFSQPRALSQAIGLRPMDIMCLAALLIKIWYKPLLPISSALALQPHSTP